MKNLYNFKTPLTPNIHEVGGKALSLIKLTQGKFQVPGGSVLTVNFFNDWIVKLQNINELSDMWHDADKFKLLADKLKETAKTLLFNEEQKSIVMTIISSYKDNQLFAVRSSSPEEDLVGASFAGGYETILGSNKDTIYEDIKTAFISCLDERVFFYKSQNGFDTSVLRIAVIIQEQINSESSGVGFSLNPLNNCYDEVVINANSGLGESVVSGMITPDEIIVYKPSKEIINQQLGSKEKAIVLDEGGGTKIIEGLKGEAVLSEMEINKLTTLISDVEEYYGFPVDIEWAYEGDILYLLQSRPITTFVPLPEELLTKPNEKPILYMDGSLIKQGITTPISVMGCDCIAVTQAVMFTDMMGKDVSRDVHHGMGTTQGGRMYINISTSAKFQGMKKLVSTWKTVDTATAMMLETLDISRYVPEKLPEFMKGVMFGAIKNNMGALGLTLKAAKDPEKYKNWYQHFEDEFDAYLKNIVKSNISISEAPEVIFKEFISLLGKMLPMTYAAELSRSKISKQLAKHFDDGPERMQFLERSLPDNVTIDMGMKMYQLSQMKEIKDSSFESFEDEKTWSEEFTKVWNEYILIYGCRTSNELDVAVSRSGDNIHELYNQVKAMSTITEEFSPIGIYNKSQVMREKTYNDLITKLSGGAAKKLAKSYHALVQLGGKREALKYWYVRSLDAVRTMILKRAKDLVDQGKLEEINDVFWMKLDQLVKSDQASKEDITEWIDDNKIFYTSLEQVNQFPKLIDSRGRILTLPRAEAKKGEVSGQPISPGVVTGRIKVLKTPTEKPLLPGEIMVTSATDPGWTPLFINAAAILLEVGGLLQHGALVAREYGKPCIVGIENVMSVFHDGQLVEVDATRGIIRLLEEDNENSD